MNISSNLSQFRVTSWNVNSLRTRMEHVLTWWDENQPDVLCLQETKVEDTLFPVDPFLERGLHVYFHGQKSYNGVAFISNLPLENIRKGFNGEDLAGQARIIAATAVQKSGEALEIINVYIPQGESTDSPKFELKQQFYAKLNTLLENHYTPDTPLVICGDYNVAPGENDVDSVEKRQGKCMFTEQEHQWLSNLEEWGLADAWRVLEPQEKVFSWWDYRALAFQLNRGLRIDLHYVTAPLKPHLHQMIFDREERKKEKPSDHIPVTLVLDYR